MINFISLSSKFKKLKVSKRQIYESGIRVVARDLFRRLFFLLPSHSGMGDQSPAKSVHISGVVPGAERHQKESEGLVDPSGDYWIMWKTGRTNDGGRFMDDIPFVFRAHIDLNLRPKIIDIRRVGPGKKHHFIVGMNMRSTPRASHPEPRLLVNAPAEI